MGIKLKLNECVGFLFCDESFKVNGIESYSRVFISMSHLDIDQISKEDTQTLHRSSWYYLNQYVVLQPNESCAEVNEIFLRKEIILRCCHRRCRGDGFCWRELSCCL